MMLISQSRCEIENEQGCSSVDFAQLRRHIGDPASLNDADRQRLVEITRRLARVQAMGDGYLQVDVSDHVKEIMSDAVAV